MTNKLLVDTNVLVYSYDRSDSGKQTRSFEVLDALARSGRGVLTPQIMGEFFIAVTRRIPVPVSEDEAARSLQNYLLSWEIVDLTALIVLEAIRGARAYQMSYWDSLIWATARLNQIPVIFSEDFNSGATLEGVRFVNPFAADFALSIWV